MNEKLNQEYSNTKSKSFYNSDKFKDLLGKDRSGNHPQAMSEKLNSTPKKPVFTIKQRTQTEQG